MNDFSPIPPPGLPPLSGITFRQLEVFRIVYRERSYSHAAAELRSTRTNVKRLCMDFEKAVGRKLFDETSGHVLVPTGFAEGLLAQTGQLYRSLRRLTEGVRSMHEDGRTVRFAAAGGFFRGGLFTRFLSRLEISDRFRACFLRIESKRFRSCLLNAECDVYFGSALTVSDRLEAIDLGPIPWKFLHDGKKPPDHPSGLRGDRWHIVETGDPDTAAALLESFRERGAKGGSLLPEEEGMAHLTGSKPIPQRAVILLPDHAGNPSQNENCPWPAYRLSAVMRRNHPYSELKQRLVAAANGRANGH